MYMVGPNFKDTEHSRLSLLGHLCMKHGSVYSHLCPRRGELGDGNLSLGQVAIEM